MNGNGLKRFDEIDIGGVVRPEKAVQPKTGSWRMDVKPVANVDECINCLLCWVNCPDMAVLVEDDAFVGFDYDYCKGCELCAEVCPVDVIDMVDNRESVPTNGLKSAGEAHGNSR